MENPATQDNPGDQQYQDGEFETEPKPNVSFGTAFFEKEYEIFKQK
jgi:hypothetical protein